MASRWVSQLLALEVSRSWRRPQIDAELRALIAQMSVENPLWGAPRIHGELLELGFEVAQIHCLEAHGATAWRAVRPELVDLPSGTMRPRSRRWTCS